MKKLLIVLLLFFKAAHARPVKLREKNMSEILRDLREINRKAIDARQISSNSLSLMIQLLQRLDSTLDVKYSCIDRSYVTLDESCITRTNNPDSLTRYYYTLQGYPTEESTPKGAIVGKALRQPTDGSDVPSSGGGGGGGNMGRDIAIAAGGAGATKIVEKVGEKVSDHYLDKALDSFDRFIWGETRDPGCTGSDPNRCRE